MKSFKIIGVLLLGIAVGGFTSWALFREPATKLRSHHDDSSLGVFSYYTDNRGAEIQHGWSYKYRFDHGDHIEYKQRFDHGRLVEDGTSHESHSAERDSPPPLVLRQTANAPKQPTGVQSALPVERNADGYLAEIPSFSFIRDATQFVGEYSQQIAPDAKTALAFARAVLSRRMDGELDGKFSIAVAPWGYQVNFSGLRIWREGSWRAVPDDFGEVLLDKELARVQIVLVP